MDKYNRVNLKKTTKLSLSSTIKQIIIIFISFLILTNKYIPNR